MTSPEKERSGSVPVQRRTACLGCRAVKAKCETLDGENDCTRCKRREETCDRPIAQKGGRPKASKNQHTALERALQVIEREVHKNKKARLELGSEEAQVYIPPAYTAHRNPSTELPTQDPSSSLTNYASSRHSMLSQPVHPPQPSQSISDPTNLTVSPHSLASQASHTGADGDYEQDTGLSNPVRLLAEAAEESDLGSGEVVVHNRTAEAPVLPPQYTLSDTLMVLLDEGVVDHRVASLRLDDEYLAQGLESLLSDRSHCALPEEDKRFFKPARSQVQRDLGPEYDPLDLALVTMKEVKVFFASFFAKLHPMLPVLDPSLHTPEFVRERSAFLLTAICAHGASLTPGAEEATKRLRIHAQRLSELISRRKFASVEIVQAFLTWISWLPSSQPFQEEKLWHETKYAINMAVELEITKPGPFPDNIGETDFLASCLLNIARHDHQMIERIERNRQRLWIHLFLWDSSLSLAFGKATRFSQDYLIRDEGWCFHPLATEHDTITTACVVLRRRMVGLSDTLRSGTILQAGSTSEWMVGKIDEVLDPWYSYWTPRCNNSPYLELFYRHSRLWSLSYGLQTLSLRGGHIQAVTDDCFSSALSTCEFVCHQLRQSRSLWGFPNTMGPMLSFEVLLAVRLFPNSLNPGPASRARLLGLLGQLSLLLERVGTTPPHRLGTAAVYGRHLQVYLRRRIIALCIEHERQESGRHGHTSWQGGIPTTQAVPARQAEMTMDQLFAINQVEPSELAQSPMALNWNDVNTLTFLDTASGWTDDFFRIFGDEQ